MTDRKAFAAYLRLLRPESISARPSSTAERAIRSGSRRRTACSPDVNALRPRTAKPPLEAPSPPLHTRVGAAGPIGALRFGEEVVMLDAVRVARDVAVEVLVEQPLRRTLLLAQTATGHEIGRRL